MFSATRSTDRSILRSSYIYDQAAFDQQDLWDDVVASVGSRSEDSTEIMERAVPIVSQVDHPYSTELPPFYLVEDPSSYSNMLVFLVTFVQAKDRVVVQQAGFLHARDPRFVYGKVASPGSRAYLDGPIVQRPTLIVPLEHLIDDEIQARERACPEPSVDDDQEAPHSDPELWLVPRDPRTVSGTINLTKISTMVYLRCKYLAMVRMRTESVQGLYSYMQGAKISDPKNDLAAQLVFVSVLAMVSESCDNDLDTMTEFEARIFETQAGDPLLKRSTMCQNGIDCELLLADSTVEHSSAAILRRAIRERYLQYVRRARAIWVYGKDGLVRNPEATGPDPEELSALVHQGISALQHLLQKLTDEKTQQPQPTK